MGCVCSWISGRQHPAPDTAPSARAQAGALQNQNDLRKKMRDLSRKLEFCEDEKEAVILEERIKEIDQLLNPQRADMPERVAPEALSFGQNLDFRMLCFGDSLTAGFYNGGNCFAPYGKAMADALAPDFLVEVWVNGLSGMLAAQLAEEVDSSSIVDVTHRTGVGIQFALNNFETFDLALIMLGTNDMGLCGAENIVQNIQTIHSLCHKKGVKTVVLSVPDNFQIDKRLRQAKATEKFISNGEFDSYSKKWYRVNASLREWAESCEDVICFVDTGCLVPWSEDTDFWERDGLHFSPSGSDQLGKSIVGAIKDKLLASKHVPQH